MIVSDRLVSVLLIFSSFSVMAVDIFLQRVSETMSHVSIEKPTIRGRETLVDEAFKAGEKFITKSPVYLGQTVETLQVGRVKFERSTNATGERADHIAILYINTKDISRLDADRVRMVQMDTPATSSPKLLYQKWVPGLSVL